MCTVFVGVVGVLVDYVIRSIKMINVLTKMAFITCVEKSLS